MLSHSELLFTWLLLIDSIREDLDHILNGENSISEDPTEADRSVAGVTNFINL